MRETMHGRSCLVTGGSGGIGRVTAEALASRGAAVTIVARSQERVRTAVDEIRRATANDHVDGLIADLSVLSDVRSLADRVSSTHDRLDVLVNNVGAVFMDRRETSEGIEMTFALNHLGVYLLTDRLMPLLRSAPSARVVTVSSAAHRFGRIAFDDLEGRSRYNGWLAYGQSKLANLLFTYELARRLEGTAITANALHPGVVATGFGLNNRTFPWSLAMRLSRPLSARPEVGARTSIHLASSPDVEGVSGRYFDRCRAVRSSRASYDPAAAARLWHVSAEMTADPGGRQAHAFARADS